MVTFIVIVIVGSGRVIVLVELGVVELRYQAVLEVVNQALDVTRRLLAAADDHTPEFGALLRVLAATGARCGEVCGLRWSDVDWHTNTLSINRSVASIAGGTIIKDTKTHAARHIAIDTDTTGALARQYERAKQCAVDCQFAFDENGFVFTSTPDGSQPLHPDSITTGFRRLCDKAGLKGVRLMIYATCTPPSYSRQACPRAPSAAGWATPTQRPPTTSTPTSCKPATVKQPTSSKASSAAPSSSSPQATGADCQLAVGSQEVPQSVPTTSNG